MPPEEKIDIEDFLRQQQNHPPIEIGNVLYMPSDRNHANAKIRPHIVVGKTENNIMVCQVQTERPDFCNQIQGKDF